MTAVVRTRAELVRALERRPGSRAVVMTMGALHAGHLSLVQLAHQHADVVVVTVFVNPLQFGPAEDLDRYPRDLDADVALLAEEGADVVYAPDVTDVYPDGQPLVRVDAGPLGDVLEGARRPGHLDGVLTVVLKLLQRVGPDVALFGEKDAQQLAAVRRMVRDLDVPVQVVGGPTVRADDGVALSSRNAYLDPEQRVVARALHQALRAAEDTAGTGRGPADVRAAALAVLEGTPGLELDYAALVDPATFADVAADHSGEAVLAVAARVGTTRLIDNTAVTLRPGEDR